MVHYDNMDFKQTIFIIMKTIFILLSIFTININYILAQNEWFDIPFRSNNSEFIFEGKIMDRESFIDERTNEIYTKNTVKVFKVFKGQLNSGFVEIIQRGGEVEDRFTMLSHGSNLFINKHSLFFAKPSEIRASPNTFRICEGDLSLDFKRDMAWDEFGSYQNIEQNVFDKLEEVTERHRQYITLNPYEHEQGYIIEDNMLINSAPSELCSVDAVIGKLNFKFENVYIENNNGQYLNFDIKISTDMVNIFFSSLK